MNIRPLFSEEDEVLAVTFYYDPPTMRQRLWSDLRDPNKLFEHVSQMGLETLTCGHTTPPTQRFEGDGGTWYTAYRFFDAKGEEYESRGGPMVPSLYGAYELIHKSDLDFHPENLVTTSRTLTAEYAMYELLKRLMVGGDIERIGETIRLIKMLADELWKKKQLKAVLKRPHDPVILSHVHIVPMDSSVYKCPSNYKLDAVT